MGQITGDYATVHPLAIDHTINGIDVWAKSGESAARELRGASS
ncbi:hypothetical protein [Mesorhizobium montanum]|nr:hypothetical protein [Mesorhizobium sp. MSK_1335]